MLKKLIMLLLAIAVFLPASGHHAFGEMVFRFEDPKSVNSIGISLNSKLEPMRGVASGIAGQIVFDPNAPQDIQGEIMIKTEHIAMANPLMTKVLHSEDWLDSKKYPTISFKLEKVLTVTPRKDNVFHFKVAGIFTCRGISKSMALPLTIHYLPEKLPARNNKGAGDLLVINSRFSIDRLWFGIKPDMGTRMVAQYIELDVGIVGFLNK